MSFYKHSGAEPKEPHNNQNSSQFERMNVRTTTVLLDNRIYHDGSLLPPLLGNDFFWGHRLQKDVWGGVPFCFPRVGKEEEVPLKC